jgi:hypothetical protein
MYRLLAFRLMFESGLVKWLSGDPNWRNLHALRFHFFTQPLPNPVAWYVHQAPSWLLDSLTGLVLFVELPVPFLLFLPRRMRHWGAAWMIGLQVIIAMTGNYAFFNLLTVAILLWAFEDQFFSEIVHRFGRGHEQSDLRGDQRGRPLLRQITRGFAHWFRAPPIPRVPGVNAIAAALCVCLAVVGIGQALSIVTSQHFTWLNRVERNIAPFEVVNSYGLFAVMTTERPEIAFEGSADGATWQEYGFPAKPGALNRALPWVAPFQPRLDWQLWFAAMGPVSQNPWAANLAIRILEGEPSVLRLLNLPPYSHPPKYARAFLYRYEFTSWEERRQSGNIWKRRLAGVYIPQVSLADLASPRDSSH